MFVNSCLKSQAGLLPAPLSVVNATFMPVPIRSSTPVDNLRNLHKELSSSPFTHLFRCAKVSASAGFSGIELNKHAA